MTHPELVHFFKDSEEPLGWNVVSDHQDGTVHNETVSLETMLQMHRSNVLRPTHLQHTIDLTSVSVDDVSGVMLEGVDSIKKIAKFPYSILHSPMYLDASVPCDKFPNLWKRPPPASNIVTTITVPFAKAMMEEPCKEWVRCLKDIVQFVTMMGLNRFRIVVVTRHVAEAEQFLSTFLKSSSSTRHKPLVLTQQVPIT